MLANPRLCVVAYGIKIDRKHCSCKDLPPHLHPSRKTAQVGINSGEIIQVKGNTYRFTRSGAQKKVAIRDLTCRVGEAIAKASRQRLPWAVTMLEDIYKHQAAR